MKKNLPGLRNDSSGVKNPTIFELQPAKEAFLVLTVLFRIAMVGFFLAFSLFFLVITLSLLVDQTDSNSSIPQGSTTTKVLGFY